MQRSLLLQKSILACISLLILGQPLTTVYGQGNQAATIEGQLRFRSGKLGSVAEYSNASRTYVIYFTSNKKPCQCSDCKEKCHCCIPQFTATTNKDGEFKASLPLGKYLMQVQLNDNTWKSVAVELKKVDESKDVEIKVDRPEPR